LAKDQESWRPIARDRDPSLAAPLGTSILGPIALVGLHAIGWFIDAKYAQAIGLLRPTGCVALALQANQFQFLLWQGQHNSMEHSQGSAGDGRHKTAGSVLCAVISRQCFVLVDTFDVLTAFAG
jgi:hypothetical protein